MPSKVDFSKSEASNAFIITKRLKYREIQQLKVNKTLYALEEQQLERSRLEMLTEDE